MTVMLELKTAIEGVINDDATAASHIVGPLLAVCSRESMDELRNQYRLFFVEPENDKSWKEYQEDS